MALRTSIPRASFLLVPWLLIAAGCHKPGTEVRPDGERDKAPALSKADARPGDPTLTPAPLPVAPKAAPEAEPSHGAEPSSGNDEADGDDAPNVAPSGGRHDRRHRASSGPSARDRSADKDASPLTVKRILFSEDIDKREPASPEETFSASQTDKIFAFVELGNAAKTKSRIAVKFIPPMGSTSKVDLDVGDKARWRTWAKRSKPKAVGTWTAVVEDEQGHELGRRTFEVTE